MARGDECGGDVAWYAGELTDPGLDATGDGNWKAPVGRTLVT